MSGPIGRFGTACLLALSATVWPVDAHAERLKPETIKAWDGYVQSAGAQWQHRRDADRAFLWSDENPDRAARVLRQEILVVPIARNIPVQVPSGLVHHWIGAAFIPNATIQDVLLVVRDYARYSKYYGPTVVDSRAARCDAVIDRFSMVVRNKTAFSKIAYENDYQTTYDRLDDRRVYSFSQTTRIREIADFGTPEQHTLPPGEGTGLIWRVNNVTRMQERDGGVHIEMEVMALSRDIPSGLRWFVGPMVRRASRDYLTGMLRQTRNAVQNSLAARRNPPPDTTPASWTRNP